MARVAIVGSGISGLACAEMLRSRHDVVVFEGAGRPGGHARTLMADGVAVDTGFIVYNEVNYPLLTGFFRHLGIATQSSDMSFGVRLDDGRVEYAASNLRGLFAQPMNILSAAHWSMLRDTLRFFRQAPSVLASPDDPSLGQLLDNMQLGRPFRERFLIPMGAAIWSTPPDQMLAFPAKTFVRFFQNHGLLSISGQHPWRTVSGGSGCYVGKMVQRLGTSLRLAAPVTKVSGQAGNIKLWTSADAPEFFDAVVFACHADETLRLLRDATDDERAVLGAFTFRDNEAVLHRDKRLMPGKKAAWASWIYASNQSGAEQDLSVTYWMNRLQNLQGPDLFVTLNPDREIPEALVLDRYIFRHPVFSRQAIAAQAKLSRIQGQRGAWFCGAWQRYGFHEDGIWSAERVARGLGGVVPWA